MILKSLNTCCFILLLLLLSTYSSVAQENFSKVKPGNKVYIKTLDGNTYTGKVLERDSISLAVRTDRGDLTLAQNQISRLAIRSRNEKPARPLTSDRHYDASYQTTSENTVWVKIKGGNMHEGQFTAYNRKYVYLGTDEGEVRVKHHHIKSIKDDTGREVTDSIYPMPQYADYFFTSSAYGLKKGEGYYRNVNFLYNQAEYGLTDYFTVGASLLPVGVREVRNGEEINRGFGLYTANLTLHKSFGDKIALKAKGIYFHTPVGSSVNGLFTVTIGDEKTNLSTSVLASSSASYFIGFSTPLKHNLLLKLEAIVYDEPEIFLGSIRGYYTINAGIQFIKHNRAIDAGLILGPIFPVQGIILSYNVPFGKMRSNPKLY